MLELSCGGSILVDQKKKHVEIKRVCKCCDFMVNFTLDSGDLDGYDIRIKDIETGESYFITNFQREAQ